MPMFFFDTRDDDDLLEDDVGVDCPDLETARAQAARALAELARDVLPASLRRELAVKVRDDRGPVLSATLRFEAIILRPNWHAGASLGSAPAG